MARVQVLAVCKREETAFSALIYARRRAHAHEKKSETVRDTTRRKTFPPGSRLASRTALDAHSPVRGGLRPVYQYCHHFYTLKQYSRNTEDLCTRGRTYLKTKSARAPAAGRRPYAAGATGARVGRRDQRCSMEPPMPPCREDAPRCPFISSAAADGRRRGPASSLGYTPVLASSQWHQRPRARPQSTRRRRSLPPPTWPLARRGRPEDWPIRCLGQSPAARRLRCRSFLAACVSSGGEHSLRRAESPSRTCGALRASATRHRLKPSAGQLRAAAASGDISVRAAIRRRRKRWNYPRRR